MHWSVIFCCELVSKIRRPRLGNRASGQAELTASWRTAEIKPDPTQTKCEKGSLLIVAAAATLNCTLAVTTLCRTVLCTYFMIALRKFRTRPIRDPSADSRVGHDSESQGW